MKLSSKMKRCGLSPMRKFNPYASAAESRGIKIYHLNIGQPDIKTPDIFYEAIEKFHDPVLSYAPSGGVPVLVKAVQEYYGHLGVELSEKEILPTSGGSEALQMLMATILEDGDEIIIPEPFYPNYLTSITLAGASIHPVPTDPEKGYSFAVRENIEAAINEHTRAIMITNPGNPTGAVLSHDELKLMLDIAKEHELFIICDEVYREFTYGGEPLVSALQFKGYEDNVIVVDSVSKRFSACGARVGMVISHNMELMDEVMKWCQCRLCSATVDQVGSAALYSLDPSYFDEAREEYRMRRDTMVSKLNTIPGVHCLVPKGAFYVMASLPIDDADKFQMWLLNDFDYEGDTVLFACGESFYATPGKGKNEVRLAYTINCQDISRAIDVLAKGIEEYNKQQH